MELRYGSALRDDFNSFWPKILEKVISQVQVISLGSRESLIAGDLLARLRKKGQSIALEDILISATAMAHNLILVTANLKHFAKIDGLAVENWLIQPTTHPL
jgi:tRNA(fMet)-specific endonuclease VapC